MLLLTSNTSSRTEEAFLWYTQAPLVAARASSRIEFRSLPN